MLNSFANNKASSQFMLFIVATIKDCILFRLSDTCSIPSYFLYTSYVCMYILNAVGLYNDKTFNLPIFKSLFSLPGCHELDHPGFTSLEFPTVIFYGARLSALRLIPQPGGPGHRIYVSQLYPQTPGSLFVVFFDSQG
jgi:hypothetical protein